MALIPVKKSKIMALCPDFCAVLVLENNGGRIKDWFLAKRLSPFGSLPWCFGLAPF